ncbi:MAG: Na/Pi cotransporter family protein [Phycisphaeraceae bacterium]
MHKRLLMGLLATLLLLSGAAPSANAVTQLSDIGLAREFEQRQAEIPEDDLNARYGLALWAFEQYDAGRFNVIALDMAAEELEAVLEANPDHANAEALLRIVRQRQEAAAEAMEPDYLWMFFFALGGLGIFLLGMKNMSEGVQAVAGDRLRRMIGSVTDNRLLATVSGVTVTLMVQSSTITTVIVVGLVNSGMMVLHQAIGVIMGANIGTTITGWILVLQIGKYGLPILGASAFVWLFSKKDRWRYLALTAMGVGMIFYGLELMKDGFGPMRHVPEFREAFSWFETDTLIGVYRAALIGCLITFVVQSSSAALGIVIGLTATGVIPFPTAAAMVLGENIGTTITAWLASLGGNTNAKRAAYAHILFNIIGVFWITLVFTPYMQLVDGAVHWAQGFSPLQANIAEYDNPLTYAAVVTAGLAATHTGFNLANTALFLPFVRRFARFLQWLVPDKGVKEVSHLGRLDTRMIESPVIAIEQSRKQMIRMGMDVRKMLTWVREVLDQEKPDEKLVRKIFHREQIMDNMQQEIIDFVTDLLTGEVPHSITAEGREQLRIADEYESVSDYVSTVLKSHLRLRKADLSLTDEERATVMELHDRVTAYVEMVNTWVQARDRDALSRAETESEIVTRRIKQLREQHLVRLTDEKVNPIQSMSYTAMLNAYRKIKDHALNIVEAMVGHK